MDIIGKDFDAVFNSTAKLIDLEGIETSPRGQKIKELINQTIIVENPLESVLMFTERKLSTDYLKAEFDWYASGELTIDGIKDHSSAWGRLLNPDGKTVNSNYGYYVYHQPTNDHKSQFDYCLENLQKDKDSRQAIINFNQPKHKFNENKDFVCTISNQFLIRENELISIVNMRSCDLIYGAGYDIPWFAWVQERMLKRLLPTFPTLKLGRLEHTSASLHIYERHFEMLKKIKNKKSDKSQNLLLLLNKQQNSIINKTES